MDQEVGEKFMAGSQIRMLQQLTSWFAYDGQIKVLPEAQHATALWKADSEAHGSRSPNVFSGRVMGGIRRRR